MNIDNPTSTKNNILVVDDKSENLKLLSILLERNGYNVQGVTSGEMALKSVQEVPPQLILLDVMMPGMDGYEVCRRLKKMPHTCEIPIIFLSALGETKDKQKAFEAGGIDYIGKPFQFEEVLMRVKNQFKLQEAQKQVKQLNEQLEARVKKRTAQLQQEIVKHKQTQKKLLKIAFYDSLTGLPNRSLFLTLLQKAIERSQKEEDYLFSVLFIDCDRFKVVNDSLGHQIGDKILQKIATRFKSCVRSMDTVARFGGDEFIILLEELEDLNFSKTVAQRLIERLKPPLLLNDRKIFLDASIGIILNTKNYQSPEIILRDADMAMYRAKESGKGCYQIFEPQMHLLAQEKLQLETDLRLAIKREEFVLYYQPIFSFQTNSIKGFEALVRWNHPQKGLLSPIHFIPIAEETGLIIPLGMWVLKEACRQLKVWHQQKLTPQKPTMNVNLSTQQFTQVNLIGQIDQILTQTQIYGQFLNLEITETAIMDNSDFAHEILKQLRKRQIGLSIDDFGTGYSSLSYLHRFPVDQLKIDRSFVKNIELKKDGLNIIETIITLAQNLNMDVVAEGIENQEQLTILRRLGCQFGQGYFFSKPLPSNLIEELFHSFASRDK